MTEKKLKFVNETKAKYAREGVIRSIKSSSDGHIVFKCDLGGNSKPVEQYIFPNDHYLINQLVGSSRNAKFFVSASLHNYP